MLQGPSALWPCHPLGSEVSALCVRGAGEGRECVEDCSGGVYMLALHVTSGASSYVPLARTQARGHA